jgi:hypothetical protein
VFLIYVHDEEAVEHHIDIQRGHCECVCMCVERVCVVYGESVCCLLVLDSVCMCFFFTTSRYSVGTECVCMCVCMCVCVCVLSPWKGKG